MMIVLLKLKMLLMPLRYRKYIIGIDMASGEDYYVEANVRYDKKMNMLERNQYMSVYLSLDTKKETINRISGISSLRKNLDDAIAQLEEVKKMNPLVKSKGADDYKCISNTGNSKTEKSIMMSMQRDALELMVAEYKSIINDYDRGWNMLTNKEKTILTERFVLHKSQFEVANNMNYDKRHIQRLEAEALRKMQNHMIRY